MNINWCYRSLKCLLLFIAIGSFFPIVVANDLEVDTAAPISQQPIIESGSGNIPIVNITEPTAGGVSHNTFKEYNVGTQGIVFNNNAEQAPNFINNTNPSVLIKEPLFINDKLHGHAAQVILTEVTGSNLSSLLGATEIYGQGADFIIANPNGIYCNGASFINAHGITLTTGKPKLDLAGVLRSLQVDRGTIEIHGKGLSIPLSNTSASPLEILTRAVKISSILAYQNNIHIYTGRNVFNYLDKTLVPQKSASNTDNPYLAIDGALVGKIGARKITIIATEQGVGVNCPSLVTDTDNIEITANGDIRLKDIQTAKDLLVESQNGNIIQEADKILANRNCTLQAQQGAIELSVKENLHIIGQAQFSSKVLNIRPNTRLVVGTGPTSLGTLRLAMQEKIHNQGIIHSPRLIVENIPVYFINEGELVAQQDVAIESKNIHNRGTIHVQGGKCNLKGHLNITNEKLICANKELSLISWQYLQNAGELVSDQTLNLEAKECYQQGAIIGKELISITVHKELINVGSIIGKQVGVQGERFDNKGRVTAAQQINLRCSSLQNLGNISSKQNNICVAVTDTIVNQGSIYSKQHIQQLQPVKVLVNHGLIKSVKELVLKASKIENYGTLISEKSTMHVTASDGIINKKVIFGKQDVAIVAAKYIENQGQVSSRESLHITGAVLTNTGELYGHRKQTLHLQALDNLHVINSSGPITLEADEITNKGIISAQYRLRIQGRNLDNKQEINSLLGELSLDMQGIVTNNKHAKLISKSNLELRAAQVTNQGEVIAGDKLIASIQGDITNDRSISASNEITIEARNLNNSHTVFTDKGQLNLYIAQNLINQKAAQLSSKETTLHVKDIVNLGNIQTEQSLQLQVDTLTNIGSIVTHSWQAKPFQRIKQEGILQVVEDITITSESLDNSGKIESIAGKLNLVIAGILLNERVLYSNKDMNLNVGDKLHNKGTIHAKDSQYIASGKLKNTGKIIAKEGSSVLRITQQATNAGKIEAKQAIKVQSDLLNNVGNIGSTAGELTIKASKALHNTGHIYTLSKLKITTDKLVNKDKIIAKQTSNIKVKGTIDNAGTIQATAGLTIQASQVTNSKVINSTSDFLNITSPVQMDNRGSLESKKQLTLCTDNLCNQVEGIILSEEAIILQTTAKKSYPSTVGRLHNEGIIQAKGPIVLEIAQQITNLGNIETAQKLEIQAEVGLDNQGTIASQGDSQIICQEKITNSGILGCAKYLHLESKQATLENTGTIAANQQNKLLAYQDIYNAGTLTSTQDIHIETTKNVINTGEIRPTTVLNIQASNITNKGSILSMLGILSLNATQRIQNVDKIISETGTIHIAAEKLENQQGIIKGGGQITFQVSKIINQGGSIHASKNWKLEGTTSLANHGDIYAGLLMSPTTAFQLDNTGIIDLQHDLDVQALTVHNSGNITSKEGNVAITVRGDIISEKGIIKALIGKLALITPIGHLYNKAGSTLYSQKEMLLKSRILTNESEIITQSGSIDMQVTDKLHNTYKIQSGGGLQLAVTTCVNEGKLITNDALSVTATTLRNQSAGAIQAQKATLKVTNHLYNTQAIHTVKELEIEAGELHNTGNMAANDNITVTVQQGDLDNSGMLVSTKGNVKVIVEKGFFTNNQLSSGGDLTVYITQDIKNTGRLVAEKKLKLAAKNIYNEGELVGKEGADITALQQLRNNNKLGSAKDLNLKVGTTLQNTDQGNVTTVSGIFTLNTHTLHNAGKISLGSAEKDMVIYTTHTIDNDHTGSIKSRGGLQIAAGNSIDKKGSIHNRGSIATEKKLILTAGTIEHAGCIQFNNGEVELVGHNKIINRGKLNALHRTLKINTPTLDNQTDLEVDRNLTVQVDNLYNSHKLVAQGVLNLDLKNLTNHATGTIVAAGKGESNWRIRYKLDNKGKIFVKDSLKVKADVVNNYKELVANQSLTLHARELTNYQKLQGGDNTKLDIIEKLVNNQEIASLGSLDIQASSIATTSSGPPTSSLKANKNIKIVAGSLNNQDIQAGEGETYIELTDTNVWNQTNVINSTGGLTLKLRGGLENKHPITAGKELKIEAEFIKNHPGTYIQNKDKKLQLHTIEEVCNEGFVIGSKEVMIYAGKRAYNGGMLQAGANLTVEAGTIYNDTQKTIVSGGNMLMRATNITNYQGNIFANGTLTLEGVEGKPADLILNETGEQEARIEAMGDMTIRAKKLENKIDVDSVNWTYNIRNVETINNYSGKTSENWILVSTTYGKERKGKYNMYCYDRYDQQDGWSGNYFSKTTRQPISTTHNSPAYILTRGNLHLHISQDIINYGSEIIAKEKIQIGSNPYSQEVPTNQTIPQGPFIKSETLSKSVYIEDAYVFYKNWRDKAGVGLLWLGNQYTDCHRRYRLGNYFTLESLDKATIRAGSTLEINARELQTGINVPTGHAIASSKSPVDDLLDKEGVIATNSFIDLPTGQYGLFKLQLDPYAPEPTSLPTSSAGLVEKVEMPNLNGAARTIIDTSIDSSLAEKLVPKGIAWDTIREGVTTNLTYTNPIEYVPSKLLVRNTSVQEAIEQLENYVPTRSDISNNRFLPNVSQPTDPGELNYIASVEPDGPATEDATYTTDIPYYRFAPAQEKIKFHFLPPLIRSNVPVDQSKFYGSPYFLRHVGLDAGQRGTIDQPLRFLGDPFYESHIIQESIRKATARSFLYNDVATPEEQVKVLIDNTAEATKDLPVALGVALSKQQINTLKKDILWYVAEEVAGQKVLVPQVYLTKNTINNLASGKGTGIHSVGDMTVNVAGKMVNTGNISSGSNQTIRAESLRNESFGSTQATIQSDSVADILAKGNIENLSGKIAGKQGLLAVSTEGQIHNKTKLVDAATLGQQASLESEAGDLTLRAKGDILNQAGKIKAKGNGSLISETGDVKNLTQVVKKANATSNSSQKDGFWNSQSSKTTTTKATSEHVVSELEFGGGLTAQARDITLMGTEVKTGGDAIMKASRDFNALSVKDLEETTTHHEEHSKKQGLLSSKTSSSKSSSSLKKATSKGSKFAVGGTFKVTSGRNTDFEGVEVTAENVDLQSKGKISIREAYNEETNTSSHSTDKKDQALSGIIKDDAGNSSSSKSYDKVGTGNNWAIRNEIKVIGKGDVVTQGIDILAHKIHIESTEGNVLDQAVEEVHTYAETSGSYQLRQGIIDGDTGKLQGEAGRAAWKLREKQEEKRTVNQQNITAKGSSFKTFAKEEKDAAGNTKLVAGDATMKAAKQVILEGTDTDMQGKFSLQGKEGVKIIEKKETSKKEETKELYKEELSLGVKNSIAAAVYQAKSVKEAGEKLLQVNAAHNTYRAHLRQAQKLKDQAVITAEEYEEVAAEEKYHVAAIATATVELAAKTKKFASAAADVVTTAGPTLGFSIDLQGDISKSVDTFLNYTEKAKGSRVKTQELEIITQGTFEVRGSDIGSNKSYVEAKEVLVHDFAGKEQHISNGNTKTANATLDIAPIPGIGVQGSLDYRKGNDDGIHHTHSHLNLGTTQLKIAEDVHIAGAQVQTSSITGSVGGNLNIESQQDIMRGGEQQIGVNASAGIQLNPSSLVTSVNGGVGGNHSTSGRDKEWVEEISSFTSSGKMDLTVGGTTKLVGAELASKSGDMQLTTKQVILEDLAGHDKRNNIGGGVQLNVSKPAGNASNTKVGGDLGYGRSRAKQKVSSSIGRGMIVETAGNDQPIIRKKGGLVNYLDTQSETKVTSEAVEIVASPVAAVKEFIEDSKVIYTAAEGMAETIVKAPIYGATGTIKQLQNTLVDLDNITRQAGNKKETYKINNATSLDAGELEKVLDKQLDQLQGSAGITKDKRASVHLYQGDTEGFGVSSAAAGLRDYKAGYDQKYNKVYVNTDKTDISKGSEIQRSVYTEMQRKETADSKRLSKISEDRQRRLAYDRGDRAAKVWDRFSEGSNKKSDRIAVRDWNRRNAAKLAGNNRKISQVEGKEVKPLLEKLDPRYLVALAKGNKEEAAVLKAEWNRREDKLINIGKQVGEKIVSSEMASNSEIEFAQGAIDAFLTNQIGGISRREGGSIVFKQGQRAGDIASILTGGLEVIGGEGMALGSVGVTIGSGGTGVLVGSPLIIAGGITIAAHGSTVIKSALNNLTKPINFNITGESSSDKTIQNSKGESVGKTSKIETKNNASKVEKLEGKINFNKKGGGKNAQHANDRKREAARIKYEEAKEELVRFDKESIGKENRKKGLKKLEEKIKHYKRELDFTGENHSRNAKGNK